MYPVRVPFEHARIVPWREQAGDALIESTARIGGQDFQLILQFIGDRIGAERFPVVKIACRDCRIMDGVPDIGLAQET